MTLRAAVLMAITCLACSTGAPNPRGPSSDLANVAVPLAPTWTGTWAVSPQSSGTTFNGQTLRQIVHTSISGSAARIQLSNVFGNQAVQIRDVHIAQRTSGSSIATGSDRVVTFGGQAQITIPAGGLAVSDSVGLSVPAPSQFAVSLLPSPATRPA